MKNFNRGKCIQNIKELDGLNSHLYKDVNDMFNVFQNKLIEIIHSNDSFITMSKKQSELRHKPWITSSIFKSIKSKTPDYRKFMKTKNKFCFDRYKHYRNNLNILITKSKRTIWEISFKNIIKTQGKCRLK